MPEQSEWISKIRQSLAGKYEKITDQARVLQARLDGVFQVLDETTGERVALKSSPQSSPSSGTSAYSIHEWDDWYDYPKSYWLPEIGRAHV